MGSGGTTEPKLLLSSAGLGGASSENSRSRKERSKENIGASSAGLRHPLPHLTVGFGKVALLFTGPGPWCLLDVRILAGAAIAIAIGSEKPASTASTCAEKVESTAEYFEDYVLSILPTVQM